MFIYVLVMQVCNEPDERGWRERLVLGPRRPKCVPDQVRYGHKHVRTVTWGIAEAVFSAENCDMEEYFGLHEIVFDLTFCVSPGLNRDRSYLINSLLF